MRVCKTERLVPDVLYFLSIVTIFSQLFTVAIARFCVFIHVIKFLISLIITNLQILKIQILSSQVNLGVTYQKIRWSGVGSQFYGIKKTNGTWNVTCINMWQYLAAYSITVHVKGPITWRVSARAEISARPLGWNFVAITWLVSARAEIWNCDEKWETAILFCWKRNHWACPSSLFSPGWNFDAITWGFSEFQPGLKFPNRAGNLSPGWIWKSLHVIANVFLTRFIQKAEVNSQPG